MHGGKLIRPITKPRLTPEHIANRLIFAKKWLKMLEEEPNLYYAFLDEKWFYTTSRRKKLKILPQAAFESTKDAYNEMPKTRSRRFPCKVMFLGVVCPPIPTKNVNGKVFLKRVSKEKILTQQTYNQHFVPTFELNHRLKDGKWRKLYSEELDTSVANFIQIIKTTYQIDDATADDLVLVYHSYSKVKKSGKIKKKLEKDCTTQRWMYTWYQKI